MKVERWPNKLGWDVATRHGKASVSDHVNHLAVSAPIPSRKEWADNPLIGPPRWRTIERYKACRVAIGTDPVEAVRACLDGGEVREEREYYRDPAPMLSLDKLKLSKPE